MKHNVKGIVLCLLLALTVFLAAGCSKEASPYLTNDAENYNVSVKFDANGGFFTTNTPVIVDSFNVSQLEKDSEGCARIALISPDDPARDKNAFTPVNNGYFLAGWYTQRTENGTDALGNPAYTYSGKWDFEKDTLSVDAGQAYSSSQPVMTLYAAWIPMFEVEVYDLATGEKMDTIAYDPTLGEAIPLPVWDEQSGSVDMNGFPQKEGFTFNGAYLDADRASAVQAESVAHAGQVDYATGTATNSVMQLYVDWMEGEWFHIYSVEQFLNNASITGSYILHADLDFTDEIWPSSLMHGSFAGTIEGNGHAIRNVTFEQTNNSKINSGLFGQLTETAKITDLTFENVTFTIKAGTRVAGASYGLLAGFVSEQAQLSNVQVLSSTLQIDSGCYFGTDDYTIGLLCGMGDPKLDFSGVSCKATGENPESVVITVENSTVTVEFVTA